MAKALVNKGVPIKADNPKDPYIRDEDGINEIINANTTFGKTLGIANGKLQLKNSNVVLSDVTLPKGTLLKLSVVPVTGTMVLIGNQWGDWFFVDPSYTFVPNVGTYYKLTLESGSEPIPTQTTLSVADDNGYTCTMDLTQLTDTSGDVYVLCTSKDEFNNTTAVYVPGGPSEVSTEYVELEIGSGLTVENGKLKTNIDLSGYATGMDIDSEKTTIQLKNSAGTIIGSALLPIPNFSSLDAGKVLTVTSDGTSLEWKSLT